MTTTRTSLGLPSLIPKRELLGSIPDPATGLICAAYRSGLQTLCCRDTNGGELHGPAPTCPVCVEVAHVWDGIDGCAPTSWGWMETAA